MINLKYSFCSRYEPPVGYLSINDSTESKREEKRLDIAGCSPSVVASPINGSTDSFRLDHSKDGSSFSSYDVVDQSVGRDLAFSETSILSDGRKSSTQRFPKSLGFSPKDLVDSAGSLGNENPFKN